MKKLIYLLLIVGCLIVKQTYVYAVEEDTLNLPVMTDEEIKKESSLSIQMTNPKSDLNSTQKSNDELDKYNLKKDENAEINSNDSKSSIATTTFKKKTQPKQVEQALSEATDDDAAQPKQEEVELDTSKDITQSSDVQLKQVDQKKGKNIPQSDNNQPIKAKELTTIKQESLSTALEGSQVAKNDLDNNLEEQGKQLTPIPATDAIDEAIKKEIDVLKESVIQEQKTEGNINKADNNKSITAHNNNVPLVSSSGSSAETTPGNDVDKLSYTIGVDLGNNLKQQNIELSPQMVYQGLRDALTNNTKLKLSEQERVEILKSFQDKMLAKKKIEFQEKAKQNEVVSKNFLEQNAKKEGVITQASGLQYKVLAKGLGTSVSPSDNDLVQVEYTARLIDGTIFDSTEAAGHAASLKISDIIPGLTEALKLMKEGDKWEIYIPPALGYGEQGLGSTIKSNEVLIYNLHLISIQNKINDTNLTSSNKAVK